MSWRPQRGIAAKYFELYCFETPDPLLLDAKKNLGLEADIYPEIFRFYLIF